MSFRIRWVLLNIWVLGGLFTLCSCGATRELPVASRVPPIEIAIHTPTTAHPTLIPDRPAATISRPTATTLATLVGYRSQSKIINSKFLGEARKISIYFPANYEENARLYYKVLYAQDGQDFIPTETEKLLADLVSNGKIRPIFLVTMDAGNGANRIQELGTGSILNWRGEGTKSQAYNRFVLEEVMPTIESSYRVLKGPQNTAIMGWSLGGLASFYLAWQHPDKFGSIGAFSPSFWWRTTSNFQTGDNRVIYQMAKDPASKPAIKMWLQAGSAELGDTDANGVPDEIQNLDDLTLVLNQKGYRRNVDFMYTLVQGGKHEVSTWMTVLPEFLGWTFPLGK